VRPDSADPGLLLKATPPRVAKWLIAREQLALSRPELAESPVLTVHAPAGFGKTSLLSQWRREWLARGAVVAWLTLDENDEAVRFSEALATAMHMASGRPAFARIGNRPATGEIERLTEWLAEVAGIGARCVLILDEVDRLPDSTESSLHYLLSSLPANTQIVLASRSRLDLPVADLLAHGQLTQIGTEGLRFSLSETLAVLQTRFGARLDADAGARLHDITGGWPLGLQLAIATIEKGSSPGEMLDRVSGRGGDIHRYFVESLFTQLPAEQIEFLTCISIVDRLSPALCQALTGRADAARLLEDLRTTTPIFADGIGNEWSSIQPLAREFLLERCEQLAPGKRQGLHAAAADWLAGHEMYEEAARHALKAGRPEAALTLADRGLFELFVSGHAARVLEWTERLPPAEVEKRPRLLLSAGWVRAVSARHAEAAPFARRALEDPSLEPGDRFMAQLMLSAALFYGDAIDEAEALADEWRSELAESPALAEQRTNELPLRGTNQLAVLALFHGNPAEARLILRRTESPLRGAGSDYPSGIGAFVEGLSYLWEGQAIAAEETLRAAHARAESVVGRRGAVAAVLAGPLALALWEQDTTGQAATILVDRLDVIEQIAPPDALIMSYVTAARLAALRGEERRAYSLLEALCALGETRRMPRLCVSALMEMIRLHAIRGRSETAATLLARLETVVTSAAGAMSGILGGVLQLERSMAAAYAAAARCDWNRLHQVLETAAPLADGLRRGREAIEIKLMRALALRSGGEDAEPLMKEALSLATAYGLRRLVLDTYPEIAAWAGQLSGRDRAVLASGRPAATAAAERAVREGEVQASAAAPSVSPSALLTPKEREVLELLARRLSNKQIASALDVGDATIKWHLKNVFAKLGAGTREHALQRARMLGILEGV
jgi:LuxR family maltose regulon positive regulatory protein